MNEKCQKTQQNRGFSSGSKSEAQNPEINSDRSTSFNGVKTRRGKASESFVAESKPESPTGTKMLMEEVCKRDNLLKALKRVKANKGSAGIDRMETCELTGYLKENWLTIKEQLLSGRYKPKPVLRVEIPKPDGGVRKLGIPIVLDRFIMQAILQVLQGMYDGTFSEYSHGFRPSRSAHHAIAYAHKAISEGYKIVVDIDLEKFFDRVNHDRLMSTLAKRIEDKRLLKIIRAFLNAGVMENGLVKPTEEGTPQGGNLSPLLSNIVLDELDKELEKRGHRFARYADDCNIYVKSERAGKRVMESITRFITDKLKLKVNQEKSAVDRPCNRKFLGYSFTKEEEPRIKISPKSLERFKDRIREITNRNRGVNVERVVKELNVYIRGWMGYYRYCQTLSELESLDSWIRRRMRCFIWNGWKTFANRVKELKKLGVGERLAKAASHASGSWSVSKSKGLQIALPNIYFKALGVLTLISFVKV